MEIRIATHADIPALHALVESGYRGAGAKAGWTHEADLLGGQRTDHQALTAIIDDPGQIMLLAESESALIGCVHVADEGIRADGLRVGYFGLLTVSPERQAGGLGRRLIAAAEDHARIAFAADVMEMTVISRRVELVQWYLRRGYVLTGREKPFPLDDPRFGLPKTRDLKFVVLAKAL
jgi:GNAT superfamily N-acetyltransferase